MTLLLLRSGQPNPLGELFWEGARRSERPIVVKTAGARKRDQARLTAELGWTLAQRQTEAALIEASPTTLAAAPLLVAARVPYALAFGARPLEAQAAAAPLYRALTQQGLRAAAQGARVVLASDEALAVATAAELDLPEVLAFGAQLDLSRWPLAARAEAQAALGLPSGGRYFGLIADLEPPLRLDLLAVAHRRVAGAGLLIAGAGSLGHWLEAMAIATRPSSPVLQLGARSPTADLAAGLAADLHLGLVDGAGSEAAWAAAALGRRQVVLAEAQAPALARLYPEHRTVFLARAEGTALQQAMSEALEEERRAGPLPAAAVERARRGLDRATTAQRLLGLVCASSW